MRLLFLFFCLSVSASTNVQNIQTWNGPQGLLHYATISGSAIGTGAWDYTSEGGSSDFRYMFLESGPSYPLPYVPVIGGSNFQNTFTNWLVAGGSNTLETYDAARLTLPGLNGGPQSNMCFDVFFKTTFNNTGGDVNWDIFHQNGQFAGYLVIQQQLRNGEQYFFAHTQGGTAGPSLRIPVDGRVWLLRVWKDLMTSSGGIRIFDYTNNFLELTNALGLIGGSVGTFGAGTNTYEFKLMHGYLNNGNGRLTGSNWFSSMVFSWGNTTLPPAFENYSISTNLRSSPKTRGAAAIGF